METAPHLGGMLKGSIPLDAPFKTIEPKTAASTHCAELRKRIKSMVDAIGNNEARLSEILTYLLER